MLRAFILIHLAVCFQTATVVSLELGGFEVVQTIQRLFNNPILSLLNSVTRANDDLQAELVAANQTQQRLEATRYDLVTRLTECSSASTNESLATALLGGYNPDNIDSCHNASLVMQSAYYMSIAATKFVLSTTNDFYLATVEFDSCRGNSTLKLSTCIPAYAGLMKDILVQTKPTAVNYELSLDKFRTEFVDQMRICFGLEDETNDELQAVLNDAEDC